MFVRNINNKCSLLLRKKRVTYIICFLYFILLNGQEQKPFKIHTIAFYNLENVFDTINDPEKYDEESPIMKINSDKYVVYKKKIRNMARVISDIGKEDTKNTPALLGVCEIENRDVLEDLVNDSLLAPKNYGIIHYESPDARGIDVALLYQKNLFTPKASSNYELKLFETDTQKRIYTRNQLLVSGYLEGELIHTIVNHWPSKRGGQAKSDQKRMAAAKLTKHIIDSLQSHDPYAKIFIMGDLNDNPNHKSLKTVIKSENNKARVGLKGIYNPFENLYKNGLGTTAFRDQWSLFDQILVTEPLLKKDYSTFQYYKVGIFNKPYLITKTGVYKGYPFRSWGNEGFTNGYSDHFPVYVYVVKQNNY